MNSALEYVFRKTLKLFAVASEFRVISTAKNPIVLGKGQGQGKRAHGTETELPVLDVIGEDVTKCPVQVSLSTQNSKRFHGLPAE